MMLETIQKSMGAFITFESKLSHLGDSLGGTPGHCRLKLVVRISACRQEVLCMKPNLVWPCIPATAALFFVRV